jgi:DNA repair protein RadD
MIDPDYEGCDTYAWPAVRYCKECGHEFRFELKFHSSTTGAAIMGGRKKEPKPFKEAEFVTLPVTSVVYRLHKKIDKPDSIRVEYTCGIKFFTSYLCPEHGGAASHRARDWWRRHVDSRPPETTDEWLAEIGNARIPARIVVRLLDRYPEVKGYEFDAEREAA